MKSRVCGKTYESYESLLAKYIRPSLGKKSLVGIRCLEVQSVCQQMSDRGLSPRTVQGTHWVLNAAFRQALQWEMVLEVPTEGLKLPRIRKYGETKRAGSRRIIRLQNWLLDRLSISRNSRRVIQLLIPKNGQKPWT
jgi:hypothetical protein